MSRVVVIFMLVAFGAACSTSGQHEHDADQIKKLAKSGYFEQEPRVRVVQAPYLSNSTAEQEIDPLPAELLDKKVALSAINKSAIQIARNIAEQAGVDIVVDGYGTSSGSASISSNFKYRGSLVGALDRFVGIFGGTWQHKNNRLELSELESKTFQIYWLGASQMTASHSSEGSAGQNFSMSYSNGQWNDIIRALSGELGPSGSLTHNPSLGQIIVRDTRDRLERLALRVAELNANYARQVQLDVRLLSVRLSDQESFSSVFSSLVAQDGNVQAALQGQSGVSLINPTVLTINDASVGDFVLNLLASDRDVSIITSLKDVAINSQPYPIKNLRELGYVASVQTDPSSPTESLATVNIGQIEIGLNLVIVPQILSRNSVGLHISLDLTELVELRTVPGSAVEAPLLERRSLAKRVILQDGQTAMLSGLDTARNSRTQTGPGSTDLFLLSGGRDKQKERDVTVLIVTAKILS